MMYKPTKVELSSLVTVNTFIPYVNLSLIYLLIFVKTHTNMIKSSRRVKYYVMMECKFKKKIKCSKQELN